MASVIEGDDQFVPNVYDGSTLFIAAVIFLAMLRGASITTFCDFNGFASSVICKFGNLVPSGRY